MKKTVATLFIVITVIFSILISPASATISPSSNDAYNYLANLAFYDGEFIYNDKGQGVYSYAVTDQRGNLYSIGFLPQSGNNAPSLFVSVSYVNGPNPLTMDSSSTIYLQPDTSSPYRAVLNLMFYDGDKLVGIDFGTGKIDPNAYYLNTRISLEELTRIAEDGSTTNDTDNSMKQSAENLFNTNLGFIMIFLSDMLENGGYTLRDLGFTVYKFVDCHGNHSWDTGVITTPPTAQVSGFRTYTCLECGMTKTEVVPITTPTSEPTKSESTNPLPEGTKPSSSKPSASKPLVNPFIDVNSDDYFFEPVLWALNHDPQITDGMTETTFAPDATCTRGQVVTFLWRSMGCEEPKSTNNPFTDVTKDDYFYKAVLWAVEKGITDGTSDTTFSPNDPCTRAHVVTFLWRSENKPAGGRSNPFGDVPSGAYYTDAILWAVSKKITDGTSDTTFSPDAPCTRGQIVTFLHRDMK